MAILLGIVGLSAIVAILVLTYWSIRAIHGRFQVSRVLDLAKENGQGWHLTKRGTIRDDHGRCPLEAAAGYGPGKLTESAKVLKLRWQDKYVIIHAADIKYPTRLRVNHLRTRMLNELIQDQKTYV